MMFLTDETGAVTVDWVVLTAALVGLGLATMTVVSGGVHDLSSDVDTQLSDSDIIFQSMNFGKSPTEVIEAHTFEHLTDAQRDFYTNHYLVTTNLEHFGSHRSWWDSLTGNPDHAYYGWENDIEFIMSTAEQARQ